MRAETANIKREPCSTTSKSRQPDRWHSNVNQEQSNGDIPKSKAQDTKITQARGYHRWLKRSDTETMPFNNNAQLGMSP